MKRFATIVSCALLLASCADVPLPVEPTTELPAFATVAAAKTQGTHTTQTVPADVTTFVSCALNGAGEMVNVTGSLHISVRAAVSASGNTHSKFHFRWAEMRGQGMTSGTSYSASGMLNESFHEGPGLNNTLVSKFILKGQGSAPDLHVHETAHVTMNANGDISVDRFETDIRCN